MRRTSQATKTTLRATTTILALCGCVLGAKKSSVPPPGKTSVAWNCDITFFGASDSSPIKHINFTWLTPEPDQATNTGRILISNNLFNESPSSVIFVMDKDRNAVDQIRSVHNDPLQFDLNTKYVSYEKGMAQIHMRLGNLILDSSTRAIRSATKGSERVSFFYEGQEYLLSSTDMIKNVEGYGPLPKTISNGKQTVCSFAGFNSGGP
jgi:hypothetical protein